nr:hypothetical protein [Pectobacterium carotovorum]
MKHCHLLLSIAVLSPACSPPTASKATRYYRIEATGSIGCLARVAVLLLEQDIGGHDAPRWQRDGTGTASFEPIPALHL